MYQITVEIVSISAPASFNELLFEIGITNNTQLYGCKSFIIPKLEDDQNIISTGSIYNGSGDLCSSGAYIFCVVGTIKMHLFETPIKGTISTRIYYR